MNEVTVIQGDKGISEGRQGTMVDKRNQDEESETSFTSWVRHFLVNAFRNCVAAVIRAGYTEETIAAYFRKKGARIGKNCYIRVTQLGDEPYLVSIGNHVFISEGVVLHTHDGAVWNFRDKDPDIHVFGTITIEDNCTIGRSAQILPNVTIGRNSIVGAGSVVITDVPPNSIVMGVPARVISSMPKYEEKCFAKWNEQRPPDMKKKARRRHLTDLLMKQGREEGKEPRGEIGTGGKGI